MARVDERGLGNVGRVSGEGVVIARFMGMVDISRITVPAEKVLPDSLYASLEPRSSRRKEADSTSGEERQRLLTPAATVQESGIDALVCARLKSLGLAPSQICTDSEFLRRASLDAIGTLPTAEQAREFLADTSLEKRSKLIDRLLEHPSYADHW